MSAFLIFVILAVTTDTRAIEFAATRKRRMRSEGRRR
jgi:hypothetical protein